MSHLAQGKHDKLAQHKARKKYEARMLDTEDQNTDLRFSLGARVMCQCKKWMLGTVVMQRYHEPSGMPIGKCVPYQVQLDPTDGQAALLIAVPFDEDRAIRLARCNEFGVYLPDYPGTYSSSHQFATLTITAANSHKSDESLAWWRSLVVQMGARLSPGVPSTPPTDIAMAARHRYRRSVEQAVLLLQMCLWGEDVSLFERLMEDGGREIDFKQSLIYAESTFLLTPLAAACMHGHAEVARWLLANGATIAVREVVVSGAYTPLHLSCFHGRPECLCVLLEHSASVLVADYQGCTPLATAACEGQTSCVAAMLGKLQRQNFGGTSAELWYVMQGCRVLSFVNEALRRCSAACQAGVPVKSQLLSIGDCLRMLLDATGGGQYLEESADSRRLLKVLDRQREGGAPASLSDVEDIAAARRAAEQAADEAARALLEEEEEERAGAAGVAGGQKKNKKKKKKKVNAGAPSNEAAEEPPTGTGSGADSTSVAWHDKTCDDEEAEGAHKQQAPKKKASKKTKAKQAGVSEARAPVASEISKELEALEAHLMASLGEVDPAEAEAAGASNDELLQWIASSCSLQPGSKPLARTVMRCILETASGSEEPPAALKITKQIELRKPLMLKYISCPSDPLTPHTINVQAACLYEVQAYCGRKNWPQGLIKKVFYILYETDIIFEDAYVVWRGREDVVDDTPGKDRALFQVNEFLQWLSDAAEE